MSKYNLLIFFTSFLLIGCSSKHNYKKYEFSKISMNTIFSITIYSNIEKQKLEKIVDKAYKVVEELEEKFSVSKPKSIVSILSKEKKAPVDEEIYYILESARQFYKISSKKFDITIGSLVRCWGFYNEGYRLPTAIEILSAKRKVGFNNLTYDRNFIKAKGEVFLDFGGILKGYAVEKVVKTLKNEGIETGIVNAGGNIKVFGKKPDGTPWRIGIRHPRKNGEIYKVIELNPQEAIATSGDYERYFITNGIRYHHIIDPATGYPVKNEIVSVSVISTNAMLVDAYSTTFFLLGVQKSRKIIENNKLKVIFLLQTNENTPLVEIDF